MQTQFFFSFFILFYLRLLGLLLGFELLLVERELVTFEDGTISAAVLTRASGDLGEDAAELELIFERFLNLVSTVAEHPLALESGRSFVDVELGDGDTSLLRLLDFASGGTSSSSTSSSGALLLLTELINVDAVVTSIPDLEGSGVDSDDGVLDE